MFAKFLLLALALAVVDCGIMQDPCGDGMCSMECPMHCVSSPVSEMHLHTETPHTIDEMPPHTEIPHTIDEMHLHTEIPHTIDEMPPHTGGLPTTIDGTSPPMGGVSPPIGGSPDVSMHREKRHNHEVTDLPAAGVSEFFGSRRRRDAEVANATQINATQTTNVTQVTVASEPLVVGNGTSTANATQPQHPSQGLFGFLFGGGASSAGPASQVNSTTTNVTTTTSSNVTTTSVNATGNGTEHQREGL
jgi:hypothetical protein